MRKACQREPGATKSPATDRAIEKFLGDANAEIQAPENRGSKLNT
jgi:hypothetical protein